jgi:hypothetical protein
MKRRWAKAMGQNKASEIIIKSAVRNASAPRSITSTILRDMMGLSV